MFHKAASPVLELIAVALTFAAVGACNAEPADDAPIAVIGKQAVPYSKLQTQIQDQLDKQQHEHELQLQQLNLTFQRNRQAFIEAELGKLLDDRVLELEAAARKTTPTALRDATKAMPITDEQARAFYDSQKTQINQPYAQIEPQLKQFLQNQAKQRETRKYLDTLRAKYKAVVTLEPLREPVGATGPQRGLAEAPVTIIEFSDFQCPYCGRFTPVLAQVLAAYPTQVRLIYRYFPFPSLHPDAEKAAEAAVCAGNQGKFWEMHDTLFAEQGALGVAALKEKAKRLGLNVPQFDACLDDGTAGAVVATDQQAGWVLGLDATPASFVNGRFVNGAVSFDEMSRLIDDELRRAAHGTMH
jgi:protein-disulfide isomerase